jgi:hypothetical protein
MRNIIKKKKCLLFKHEKNNQTLSNDWPTYMYCHTGMHVIENLDDIEVHNISHFSYLPFTPFIKYFAEKSYNMFMMYLYIKKIFENERLISMYSLSS